jgi:hypothetical protein
MDLDLQDMSGLFQIARAEVVEVIHMERRDHSYRIQMS